MAEQLIDVNYYQPGDYYVVKVRNPEDLNNQDLELIVEHLKQEHADKRIALKVTNAPMLTRIPNLDGLDIVSLALVDNNLMELDQSVSNLQELEYLNVSGNPDLTFLPDGIIDLPSLVEFYAEETHIPQNIIDQILERAFERAEGENNIVGGKRKKRRQSTKRKKSTRRRGGRMSRRNKSSKSKRRIKSSRRRRR